MNRFAKFIKLSLSEQLLLIAAILLLAVARLALLTLKFRWIAPWLGQHLAESDEPGPSAREALISVRWAVRRAASVVPWTADCLPQAIAAKVLLQAQGVGATLYLGLKKEETLAAHACLKTGSEFVTGENGADSYTVVATFT